MINIINKKIKKSVALMLIGVVYTASMFSVRALGRKVDIDVDNDTISTMTLNSETDRILEQVGINLSKNDSAERHDQVDGSLKINVKRAFDVNIFQNDKKITLQKSSGKVKDVLDELGISEEDRNNINFSEEQKLYPNIDIIIGQKVKITLNIDGESKECFVPEGTVKETLDYLGVELSPDDETDSEWNLKVFNGMQLTVNRIVYREVKNFEEIPFRTEIKRSALLNGSENTVSRAGKKGIREVTLKEKLKDGKVVKSEEINSKIILNPVNEVVITSKKSSIKNNNTNVSSVPKCINNSNVLRFARKGERCISGSATAYTASRGAKTSTGVTPIEGVTVAVDPRHIPYGTPVRVETNDGKVLFKGIAQDTGGALRKGSAIVDIYMNSTDKCLKFGRKNVKVYY